MSLSEKVLSSCLRSREAYKILHDNTSSKDLLPDVVWLMDRIGHYYDTDPEAEAVDQEVFTEQVRAKFPNPTKAEGMVDTVNKAFNSKFSVANYLDLCKEIKRQGVAHTLAGMLSSSEVKEEVVEQLMEEYKKLALPGTVAEDESNIIHNMSVEDAINKVLDKSGRIYLAPKPLHEATDGAMAGDFLVIFARPEVGKTALCCTLMAGFAWQKLPGIFFSNEEPTERVAARAMSCLTGMTAQEIADNPDKATKLLADRGWHNIRFIRLQRNNPAEVEKYVKMYGAKWFIVDQLRNLNIPKLEGKTQVLEESAKALRAIAGTYGAVGIGVTQAGDSGENKLRLTQGDVDGSNTGIPGACDLMIGLGVNEEFEQQQRRMINLPKNKLSGKHVFFPLKINELISRLEAL